MPNLKRQLPSPNASPDHSNAKQNTADTTSEVDDQINWYTKLHPLGVNPQSKAKALPVKPPLNLSLFFRVWLAVAVIIIVSGVIVFTQLFNYVRPVTQQVIEDTLVDSAEVLATVLQRPLETGEIYEADYQATLDNAFINNALMLKAQSPTSNMPSSNNNNTWYNNKTHSSFRVYITDNQGMVIYDSNPEPNNAEGEDYSQWNDIYRTLRGDYGARTTRYNLDDENTSIMYVAKPIYASDASNPSHIDLQNIVGVVSVGKPTATILPYLDATRQRMLTTSAIIILVALILAGLVAWWLKQSMKLVTRYTQSLAQDANKPYFFLGRELNELSDTIETMKHKLENRAYVSDYVHTLTHELKSPLTAIRASGELLEDTELDDEDKVMLSQTITEQSIKMQALIDRLLLLAKIEQPTFRLTLESINIQHLMATLIRNNESQRLQNQVSLIFHTATNIDGSTVTDKTNKIINATNNSGLNKNTNEDYEVIADRFWLTQALQNLIDNALYFASTRVDISLRSTKQYMEIAIYNDGNPIPEYALGKVFDRYFSLSYQAHLPPTLSSKNQTNKRPNKRPNKKGTGLGLTLVQQVIERHDGSVAIQNIASELKTDSIGVNSNISINQNSEAQKKHASINVSHNNLTSANMPFYESECKSESNYQAISQSITTAQTVDENIKTGVLVTVRLPKVED